MRCYPQSFNCLDTDELVKSRQSTVMIVHLNGARSEWGDFRVA